MYRVEFSNEAKEDIKRLQKQSPANIKKLTKLIVELQEHPRTGTGQIEILKYYEEETWSRRLDKKHRVIYRIQEEFVTVLVISAYGHYDDK
jgi:toxin YoeB